MFRSLMMSGREQLEAEIAAQVGSWLDVADEKYERGYEVKTWAVIFETEFPPFEEGGYPDSQVSFTCPDTRNWVRAGLFRRAMLLADLEIYESHEYEADEESEGDES